MTRSRASLAEQADHVAAAVLAVPGVVRLHGGTFDEVAVHLPDRRVRGVRLLPDLTEVHVVLSGGLPVQAIARDVRAAVAAVRSLPVDVVVGDLEDGPVTG